MEGVGGGKCSESRWRAEDTGRTLPSLGRMLSCGPNHIQGNSTRHQLAQLSPGGQPGGAFPPHIRLIGPNKNRRMVLDGDLVPGHKRVFWRGGMEEVPYCNLVTLYF